MKILTETPANFPELGDHVNPAGETRTVLGYVPYRRDVLVRWSGLEGERESSMLEWARWQAKRPGAAAVVPVAGGGEA